MMFAVVTGARAEFHSQDPGSSLVDLIEVQEAALTVESVVFCNRSGSATTITMAKLFIDGVSLHYYLDEESLDKTFIFDKHAIVLSPGETLQISAPANVDVSAIAIQSRQ